MKKTSTILIALILAALTALLLPAQVFADSTSEKYISEIKIGVDKKADKAAAALEGYEILKGDDGKPVDLNKDAGGGVGSKGNRVVYLGFKRTSDRSKAVSDLAVMNMKGGYKTQDYELLMEKYMHEQILPFVNGFISAIEEYRQNYNSANPANKERATYIHDLLNKMTDDDCGGAPLGDLFLNETKYEMGDTAYNALSEADKNRHADIVTIIAQANGKATLMLENLITRAADASEDTWIDRFTGATYDDMEEETGLSPSKARAALDKLYYDDAQSILQLWEALREQLLGADDDETDLENTEVPDNAALAEKMNDLQNDVTMENAQAAADELLDNTFAKIEMNDKAANVVVRDYLKSVEYEDGTLYDFFTQDYEDISDDYTALYPLVAALSDGQKSGLQFISLRELILIGSTSAEGYRSIGEDPFEGGSIYDGVDREIFKPGGIALTSDAIRTNMALQSEDDTSDSMFHWYTYAMMGLSAASLLGCVGTFVGTKIFSAPVVQRIDTVKKVTFSLDIDPTLPKSNWYTAEELQEQMARGLFDDEDDAIAWLAEAKRHKEVPSSTTSEAGTYTGTSNIGTYIGVGLAVATVIISAVTLWLTFKDLKDHYKVDFTPAPRYIVDEKDITAYNAKGEKIVINNLAAYYKAVPCNRTEDAEYYKVLGTVSDLNGDVGKQWLALYAERNDLKAPILADSFKVTASDQIPAGYETGIHMFGSAAAENLNNPLYVWKDAAPKVFVYFKVDSSAANNGAGTTGSNFTGGTLALTGAAGLAVGVLITAVSMSVAAKRKKKVAAAA